jgi:hypothetical protein
MISPEETGGVTGGGVEGVGLTVIVTFEVEVNEVSDADIRNT